MLITRKRAGESKEAGQSKGSRRGGESRSVQTEREEWEEGELGEKEGEERRRKGKGEGEEMRKRGKMKGEKGGRDGRREGKRQTKMMDRKRQEEGKGDGRKNPRDQRALNSPVLYTCSSSTIPSLPPPNTTMSSLMATARWPWRGRGTGPDQPTTRFQRGCRSTAGELAGDTAEAIVPGKGAVGKVTKREWSPSTALTHPLSSKAALTQKRVLTQRCTAPWRPPS